jgi:hypothetical protein
MDGAGETLEGLEHIGACVIVRLLVPGKELVISGLDRLDDEAAILVGSDIFISGHQQNSDAGRGLPLAVERYSFDLSGSGRDSDDERANR